MSRRVAIQIFGPCLCLALAAGPALAATVSAPDPLPIIVTYEQQKQRREARLIARNPKAFWVRQIVARLEARKPELPKALKDEAVVQLTFVVGHDGTLVSKVVSHSSGNEMADRTALAMVEKAKPFPAMPAGMDDSELTFSIPVRFR